MRYQIRIDPWWRPLLLGGGVTRVNSYVEISADDVTFRFGFWFRRTFQRGDIEGAAPGRWPIWLGGRLVQLLRGEIGLIGSFRGVVELRLRTRARWGLAPFDRIAVSLEDPDGFIAALSLSPPAATDSPKETPPSNTAARPRSRKTE